jgi:hypothetical protein
MKKTSTARPFLVLLSGALWICAAINLSAQTYNYSEDYSGITQLAQSGVTGAGVTQALLNNDCAPVAAANGLSYLYGLAPAAFAANPDTYTAVSDLITDMQTSSDATDKVAGTTGANALSGLQAYLSPTGANPAPYVFSTTTQITDPTVSSLGAALSANQAVQLGILWESFDANNVATGPYKGGGGHFVSLTGMNLTDSGGNITGSITVLDPWGNNSLNGDDGKAGVSALTLTLQVFTTTIGSATVIGVSYPSPGAANPQDTTTPDGTGPSMYGRGAFNNGYIEIADIECVPEPTTMSLLLLPFGAGALRMLRRNRAA